MLERRRSRSTTTSRARTLRAALLIGLIPGLAGMLLERWPLASALEYRGLDLLFQLRGARKPPAEVCIVAIDADSLTVLELSPTELLPRRLHAQLIRTLKQEGARVVAVDVLFDSPRDPAGDGELESAIREAGNVVLASAVDRTEDPLFVEGRRIEPLEGLARAAVTVGDVRLPMDMNGVIYTARLSFEDRPSLALATYEAATKVHLPPEVADRIIDYYGPARTVKTVSLYQAIEPSKYLPPGFFKDKIVFVGRSLPLAAGADGEGSFLTPYRTRNLTSLFGVEIHATVAANLFEHRRIELLPRALEDAVLLGIALFACAVLIYLRPVFGVLAFFLLELAHWTAGFAAFSRDQLWIPMIVPAAVQLPAAYVLSLIWYYLTTVREREHIRRAFSFYLSPEMIARISADPASLNLGGKEIVATALFTDIEGFTTIAESMPAPDTAPLLNAYFSDVSRHIFEEGGTLIKFIGDAVFAIWGAPIPREDHAAAACRAALALGRTQDEPPGGGPRDSTRNEPGEAKRETGSRPRSQPRLVTRIGVHTGPMLVGNFGSAERFDYTAIGDAVNVASRLEGLNKHLGTRMIVSGAALAATGGGFLVRPLGRVRVAGKTEPIEVFELLGLKEGRPGVPDEATIARFEQALSDFSARRFERAAAGFREVLVMRGGSDGPSEFYLRAIDKLTRQPLPPDWDGVVALESK